MRAGRIGRTIGRTVAIALFGLTVTVAGIVGVQAAVPDEYTWDSVPSAETPSTGSSTWGAIVEEAAASASEYTWD
jgi:hypothetical protein